MFGLVHVRWQLLAVVFGGQILSFLSWYWSMREVVGDSPGPQLPLGSLALQTIGISLLCWGLIVKVAGRELKFLLKSIRTMLDGELKIKLDQPAGALYEEVFSNLQRLGKQLNNTRRDLRSERDRLDRVLSSMQEGVMLLDKDGKVQLVNDSLRQMLLLGPEVQGRAVAEALPDEQLVELLKAALEGQNTSQEMDLKGPPPKQVLASVRRLRKRRGALAVLVDITARRRLETVRQEFVANASHELRTPIAAILSAAETLQDHGLIDESITNRFMEMIVRNATRLRTLVDDLLEVSQLESGRIKVDLEPLNLRNTVEHTLHSLVPRARSKQTNLVSLVPSNCIVLANPRGLDHIVGNLVQNAINYCPNKSRVEIECEESGNTITMFVKDNGPGIEKKHVQRLFERFYRVDSGRSRDVGGTGLGLAIVKHWVEAMNGSVGVTSVLGEGTTFRVTLSKPPTEPEQIESVPPSEEDEEPPPDEQERPSAIE